MKIVTLFSHGMLAAASLGITVYTLPVQAADTMHGSDYYTIPNKDNDSEPFISHSSQTPKGSALPDIVPFENFDKLPDRPTMPASKLPTKKTANKPVTTKSPENQTQPATKPSATVTNSNTTRPSSAKEKIIPMAKKVNLKFSDFPAKVYAGKRAAPKLSQLKGLNSFYGEALTSKGKKGEQQFIQSLTKAKPNFAGHYVVTSFTCGLNCNASVAYDLKTGDFMELGGGFADCPATDFNSRQKASITHQANSRLLIVIGSSSSGSCMAGYFEEKNGNVSLINQKNLMTYVS